MKRYDTYKNSGIEWIGEIPEHWEVNKFNRISFFQEGPGLRNWQFTQKGIKVICVTNIVPPNIDFSKYKKCISVKEYEEKYRHFTVNTGDLLLASSGASWGKVSEYKNDEIVILNTSTIRLNKNDNSAVIKEFIKWIIQSPYIEKQLDNLLTGSCQPNFGPTHLKQLHCTYPIKIEEQTAIANFLDKKTTEIDQLITQKESLLKLYEEEKTAIINQAVTKGINPKVKLKDSGVDWLGEIPVHWEVKKLKYVVSKIGSGVTPRGGASVYQLSGIPFLRSQNIHFDRIILDNVAYISESINNKMEGSKVFQNDVLLNITGASIGRCYFVTNEFEEANVNQHVCIIRPKKLIFTKFLYYILRSNIGQEQIRQEQTGSGREGLNFEVLKQFYLPFLRKEEQTQIVNHIETETAKINTKVTNTKKLIALLKEYKTALISEVVTGKIKVN